MGELGSLLARAREARGLTLEDAERDTRISRRYLQALEAEQFEVIPAPVYARGFLRSYSQYLGLDPAEALAMFPREEDAEYQRAAEASAGPQRASKDSPVSPVSAARPSWKAAPTPPREPVPARAASRQAPLGRPAGIGSAARKPEQDPSWEPVIGIDIGVPTPAHRLNTDPAAQTRSLVVAIAAVGVVVGAVLLAILISNLGGSGNPPPGTGIDATRTSTTPRATAAGGADGSPASGVQRGVVPAVEGLPEAEAKKAIADAGYTVRELRSKNSADKGIVFSQSPAAGIEYAAGQVVQIFISEGQ